MGKYIGEKGVIKAEIVIHNRENWEAIDYMLKANRAPKLPGEIQNAAQQLFELGCKYAILLKVNDSGKHGKRGR